MNHTLSKAALLLAGAAFVLSLFLVLTASPFNAHGSVAQSNEYQATTTFALSTSVRTLKTGFGSLAQVTITGDNTGLITIYNATTSDINARTGNKATSTLVIADFPASTPEGTYTFDAQFTDGLLVVTSGAPATSTITYR